MSLLQEIYDLMEAGVEIWQQKRQDKKNAKKEAKKKISLLKSGKDIRLCAMQTLKGNDRIYQWYENMKNVYSPERKWHKYLVIKFPLQKLQKLMTKKARLVRSKMVQLCMKMIATAARLLARLLVVLVLVHLKVSFIFFWKWACKRAVWMWKSISSVCVKQL